MNVGKQVYNSINFLIKRWMKILAYKNDEIVMMQKKYESEMDKNFKEEFHNIILLTYRYDFPEIKVNFDSTKSTIQLDQKNFSLTSDVGWGCMIRVMQMSIINGILKFLKNIEGDKPSIKDLLKNFQDDENAPFSIHRIVSYSSSIFGINPASWMGPTSSSIIANKLINENQKLLKNIFIASIVFEKGTFYRNLAKNYYSNFHSNCCTFVWLCMKLGTNKFNIKSYKKSIISVITFIPQFVCIAGGHNSSALFIVGASDTFLYCLDPHVNILPYFSLKNYVEKEFIQENPKKILWEELSPSLSIVFICKNFFDFEDLCQNLVKIDSELFEVLNCEEFPNMKDIEFDSGFLIL